MADLTKVRLRVVLQWVCPKCGRDRYHVGEPIAANLDPATSIAGYDVHEVGEAPEFVYCGPCESRFEVDFEAQSDEGPTNG